MHASKFLQAGLQHMQDRAETYDKPQGERSMGMTVALANVLLADKLREPLSEEDGWNIMQLLKLVRSKQGNFKADNYEDGSAYAGLAGEAAYRERVTAPNEAAEADYPPQLRAALKEAERSLLPGEALLKPCRNGVCSCFPGKCCREGHFDARGEPAVQGGGV